MDSQPSAPPVVAVVVATEQGDCMEESLAALAAQDYPNQSVLVVDAGVAGDPAARVAAVLPDAYLRRPADGSGFAALANDALTTVQGSAFLLFCHDDVAPAPDAVRILVEEALRSNAGIVGPKIVDWENPERLLDVGLAVDKTGETSPLVERGELDQEQHDAVRDVFAVSSACLLARSDLFFALGGFDPAMGDNGADVDLCWRAQVAGARVMVAPAARARHREAGAEAASDHPRRLREESRNHLRTVLKSYSLLHLVRVLPQAAVVMLVEAVVALFTRRWAEARALAGAWAWNLRHLGQLPALRRSVRATRAVPDNEVRRLHVRGSVRMAVYLRRQLHAEDRARALVTAGQQLMGRVGRGPAQAATGLLVLLVLAFLLGSRHLLGGRLPAVGQLLPLPRSTTLLSHFLNGWRTTGMGSASSPPPLFGLLGLGGLVLLGKVALLQKLLVLAAWPVAAMGAWRLGGALRSGLGRIVLVVAYLAIPLSYNSLSGGHWDGLVAFAAAPFLLAALGRLGGLQPFADDDGPPLSPGRLPTLLGLTMAVALLAAFAPGVVLVVLIIAVGLLLGSVAAGEIGAAARALAGAGAAVAG
ncbi:MAG TPA: glycosyltransferase, partial [Acidimicrobiales bacterium]|nr:glycosyltransferase [Acidimicrobiales bacterium]